jgi:hypothetical protein
MRTCRPCSVRRATIRSSTKSRRRESPATEGGRKAGCVRLRRSLRIATPLAQSL